MRDAADDATPIAALLPRRQVFADVVVMPTEAFHQGSMFRGGPVWPRFALQFRARHARGRLPIPRDARPSAVATPVATLDTATWCGPVAYHFGHAIADFGMRIAVSGYADRERPLLFGMLRDVPEPPDFFWQILDHLGIDRGRVVLVREPTLVRALHVFPQAERRGGPGPTRRHLDLMDRIVGRSDPSAVAGRIYVSRARLRDNRAFLTGQIAGESYIEGLIAGEGVRIVHPEALSVAEQMDAYRQARAIVFAEGSAVHGLQLLGRIDADVIVVARRRRARIAVEALAPRARSVTYLHALRGTIHGLLASGRPDRVRAIAVLEPKRLLDGLAAAGLDLRGTWDEAAYRRHRDADIAAWREATLSRHFHPRSAAIIAGGLRRLSID